jgi:tripartite-type tricarboxylate transporter receptor subunit TctC
MAIKGFIVSLLLAMAVVLPANAGYPEKPIRIVIPFPPGGSTGYAAKVLAGELEKVLGQPVTLDTKSGNFGINAISQLIGQSDGYTLMVGSVITNSMTPVMHRQDIKFDYDSEILPVTRLADFPSVVMVSPSAPANTLKDFLASVKQTSGKLTLGTDFIGTFVDVDTIRLAKTANLKVAYHANPNGANGVLADLVAGKSNIALLNVATATANMGKYKPLAVTGSRRLPNFPDVPTMSEAGYAGIGTSNWQGLFISRRTPPDIVRLVQEAALKAMSSPEAKSAFDKVNAAIVTSETPAKFAEQIKSERTTWQQLQSEVLALPAE